MNAPITPADIATLAKERADRAEARVAELECIAADRLALLDQLATQAEIADKLNREIDSIQDQWKAERSTTEAKLAAQAAEIERLRAELSESEKRVTAIVVIGAIMGSEWFCEQADGAERPSWSDAIDIVRKLKGERNAAQARVAELEGLLRDADHHFVELIDTTWSEDSDIRGDRFEDIHERIDAVLAKREGGR